MTQTAQDDYGLGSNLSDIIAARGRKPPSLEYLKFGDPTTYGQTYCYSEEMLEALGETKKDKPPAKPSDMDSPWAVDPKELHEPIVSLYGKDFDIRNNSGKAPISAEELARRSKAMKAELEAKREKARSALDASYFSRCSPSTAAATPSLDGTLKHFDHQGVTRRTISEPLQKQIEAARVARPSRKPPQAIPDICNPLMGGESIFAWNPGSVAAAIEMRQKSGETAKSQAESAPVAFWYPKDRQLKKHQRLELQRLTEGTSTLVESGWTPSCDFNGREKKTGHPELATSLSPEEQEKVVKQLETYRAELQKKKEERERKRKEELEREAEAEAAAAAKKKGNPRPLSEPLLQLSDYRGQKSATVDEGYYKPELPASRLSPLEMEKLKRLTLPPDPRRRAEVIAPPWGRPEAAEDRYEKIRVYNSRTKKVRTEFNGKLEVDRELRVIRDGGLLKREKRSLLKTMDPEQLKYIKSMGNEAMRPAKLQ
jgi:hypothetical protein